MTKELHIIYSTDVTLAQAKTKGVLDRIAKLMERYAEHFDVTVYTCDYRNFSEELGIKHRNLHRCPQIPVLKHISYYLFLLSQARNMRGTVRIYGVSLIALPLLKYLAPAKIVASFQWDWAEQSIANYPSRVWNFLLPYAQKKVIQAVDYLICTARWLEDKARTEYGIEQTIVIPNYVDEEIFYPSDGEKRYILFSGRIHHSKGIDVLIRAFKLLLEKHPDEQLVICGHGEKLPEYQELVENLSIGGYVHFLGTVRNTEVANLLRQTKVFALPTVTMEGHPKALIEAMGSRVACVVSDVPGNIDVAKSSSAIMVARCGDVQDLFEKLDLLLSDKALREDLAKRACEHARRYFFSETFRRELEIYDLLDQRKVQ